MMLPVRHTYTYTATHRYTDTYTDTHTHIYIQTHRVPSIFTTHCLLIPAPLPSPRDPPTPLPWFILHPSSLPKASPTSSAWLVNPQQQLWVAGNPASSPALSTALRFQLLLQHTLLCHPQTYWSFPHIRNPRTLPSSLARLSFPGWTSSLNKRLTECPHHPTLPSAFCFHCSPEISAAESPRGSLVAKSNALLLVLISQPFQ